MHSFTFADQFGKEMHFLILSGYLGANWKRYAHSSFNYEWQYNYIGPTMCVEGTLVMAKDPYDEPKVTIDLIGGYRVELVVKAAIW